MIPRLGRFTAVLLLALGVALGGCASPTPYPTDPPELVGTDLDGTARDLADLDGQVVLVNVWASWCGPCRDEIPDLVAAQEEFGADGLTVLGVNMRDRPAAARDMIAEFGAQYPSIVDADGTTSVGWGVVGIPMTFVIDRDGRLVDRHAGPVTAEWIDDVAATWVRP